MFAHVLAFDLSGHASGASPSRPFKIWAGFLNASFIIMVFVFRAGSAEVAHVPLMG